MTRSIHDIRMPESGTVQVQEDWRWLPTEAQLRAKIAKIEEERKARKPSPINDFLVDWCAKNEFQAGVIYGAVGMGILWFLSWLLA